LFFYISGYIFGFPEKIQKYLCGRELISKSLFFAQKKKRRFQIHAVKKKKRRVAQTAIDDAYKKRTIIKVDFHLQTAVCAKSTPL